MKNTTANAVRAKYLEIVRAAFAEEDVGIIASNAINFPIVTDDGEEGWVEITIKIPKEYGDEGFDKREEYRLKCEEREAKAKEAAEKKARKIERDKAEREARKATKEKDVLGTTLCTYCGSNERKVYNQESGATDSTNANKYYRTYCPSCGREGLILKQSFNGRDEQEGE